MHIKLNFSTQKKKLIILNNIGNVKLRTKSKYFKQLLFLTKILIIKTAMRSDVGQNQENDLNS